MKTLYIIVPGFVYLFSTVLSIMFISVLLVDILNYNKSNSSASFKQPDELFPKFIKIITLKNFEFNFAGVDFPK